MKKMLFYLVLFISFCFTSIAQKRNEGQALSIANEFFEHRGGKPSMRVVPQRKLKAQISKRIRSRADKTVQSSFYVINDEESDRFVIISADERLQTILGYSENGTFDPENTPEGLLELLDNYNGEYEYILSNPFEVGENHVNKVKAIDKPNLIKTQWGQDSPFNNYCPQVPSANSNCVTGCVATAMAQVMNFYKYPKSGQGSISYTTDSLKLNLSADFNAISFDWENMANNYNIPATSNQKKAVAQLMRACGVACLMNYGQKGSGATLIDMAYSLIHTFNYNPNLRYMEKKYYTNDMWDSIIIDNLIHDMPVVYSANDDVNNGGHCFIIDGSKKNDGYHVNWGWSGYCDGYFQLTAMNPSNHKYNTNQSMICYITPNEYGCYQEECYTDNFILKNGKTGDSQTISLNKTICATANQDPFRYVWYKKFILLYNRKINIGVFDTDTNFIADIGSITQNRQAGSCFSYPVSIKAEFNPSILKEGYQYYIKLYTTSDNGVTKHPVHTLYGNTDYYLAKVNNGNVEVSPRGIPDKLRPIAGNYKAIALDESDKEVSWDVIISYDVSDSKKIWFTNIDKSALDSGYQNGKNRVYGVLNDYGFIELPSNQEIGDGLVLNNFSSTNDTKAYVSITNNSMLIDDVWGTVTINDKQSKSRYKNTILNYVEPTSEMVESPVITVSKNMLLNIFCPTKGAIIYYTFTANGSTPTTSSDRFNSPFYLNQNGIVKAIAIKNGIKSEITTEVISSFKVEKPAITSDKYSHEVNINTTTEGATIYYTVDGSNPSLSNGIKYIKSFTISETTTIKAIAVKNNWQDSEIVENTIVIKPLEISNNNAGCLSQRIADTNTIKGLSISGEINGTDIKLIRDMFTNGNLSYLDLSKATIVSGGAPYYANYNTENNSVGKYMFSENDNLQTLILPESIEKFEGITNCTSIKVLDIPNQCESVGEITGCKKLETLIIPSSVKEIGGVGMGCDLFKEYIVAQDNNLFKSVDGVLFSKNGSMLHRYPICQKESYTIPTEVKYIGRYAFSYCNLNKVIIPDYVQSLFDYAFYNSNINYIEFGNGIIRLYQGTFANCTKLTSVYLPESLIYIDGEENYDNQGEGTFQGCSSLKEVYIGSNLSKIGGKAFKNCNSLQQFIVKEENTHICSEDGVIYSKDKKTLMRFPTAKYVEIQSIPEGVETIDENAFSTCRFIKELYLPESIKEIKNYAFSNCDVSNIHFPKTLNSIGMYAFNNCSELITLVLPDEIKKIGIRAFTNCRKLKYLYLPSSISELWEGNFTYCDSLSTINSDIVDISSIIKIYKHEGIEGLSEISGIEGLLSKQKIGTVHTDSQESVDYRTEIPGLFDDKYLMGLFDDEIWIVSPSKCTWLIPFGSSESYKKSDWWYAGWTIQEKTQERDCNADNIIDERDLNEMAGYILGNVSDNFVFDVSDLNDDGEVDVSDIALSVYLDNHETKPKRMSAFIGLDNMSLSNVEIESNEEKVVSINLAYTGFDIGEQYQKFVGFQFVITMPEGISVLGVAPIENHNIQFSCVNDSTYRILCYSISNSTFSDSFSTINLTIKNNSTRKFGAYPCSIQSQFFTDFSGGQYRFPDSDFDVVILETIQEGDSNADGVVDEKDMEEMANYILGKQSDNFVFDVSDLNQDGVVDVLDIAISAYMEKNGFKPDAMSINADCDNLTLQDSIFVSNNSIEIPFVLSKKEWQEEKFVGFQFEVVLPNGINLIECENITDHIIKFEQIAENRYRVICYSPSNLSLPDSLSSLKLTLMSQKKLAYGKYPIVICSQIFAGQNGGSFLFTEQEQNFVVHEKCDVNLDGKTDISDIVAIINYIAGQSNGGLKLYDANEDSMVDISDVVSVINAMANPE